MTVRECKELAWYQQKERTIFDCMESMWGGDRVASYNNTSQLLPKEIEHTPRNGRTSINRRSILRHFV